MKACVIILITLILIGCGTELTQQNDKATRSQMVKRLVEVPPIVPVMPIQPIQPIYPPGGSDLPVSLGGMGGIDRSLLCDPDFECDFLLVPPPIDPCCLNEY